MCGFGWCAGVILAWVAGFWVFSGWCGFSGSVAFCGFGVGLAFRFCGRMNVGFCGVLGWVWPFG